MEEKINIDKIIADALTEKPITITIDGRFFYVYPPSLGVSLIAKDLLGDFKLDENLVKLSSVAALLGAVSLKRDAILKLIAIHTFENRHDAVMANLVEQRMGEISVLNNEELVALIMAILDWNTWVAQIEKHFNIDKQRQKKEKVMTLKNQDTSSISFGGDSLWGSLVGFVAEKFGWSMQYIVWGCSFINLSLVMSDCITSVYLTDEERKKLRISTDGVYVNADGKDGNDRIREILGGR